LTALHTVHDMHAVALLLFLTHQRGRKYYIRKIAAKNNNIGIACMSCTSCSPCTSRLLGMGR